MRPLPSKAIAVGSLMTGSVRTSSRPVPGWQDEVFGLFGRRQWEDRGLPREVGVGVGGIGFVGPAPTSPAPLSSTTSVRVC